MKIRFLWTLLICAVALTSYGQSDTNGYRNFPIVVSLQFHSFSLPFHNLKSNFKNIGIGLGTEVSLNGKQNWAQQINMVWFHNKEIGNGLFFYTQSAWRPTVVSETYTELKIGAGYLFSFRPTESYKQENGEWKSVGHRGKPMFTIPVGVSVSYTNYSTGTYLSPFVTYQFLVVNGYNQSVPIVPETLIQVGTRIHTK